MESLNFCKFGGRPTWTQKVLPTYADAAIVVASIYLDIRTYMCV